MFFVKVQDLQRNVSVHLTLSTKSVLLYLSHYNLGKFQVVLKLGKKKEIMPCHGPLAIFTLSFHGRAEIGILERRGPKVPNTEKRASDHDAAR